ncbi:hypothetical protein PVAR5_5844 [Paecilomyces variotii No. 5]|uniref:Oxidation resistance protein 1 n=1 Tax=Byssochlamys spectabilis (strain No. 5 / NBRC 109023) TaxID=1356009 RepID=V5FYK6_BYSSN|nr:hypothetical protein PVAR5_5844 [Paecilomyces variotii No. 5]
MSVPQGGAERGLSPPPPQSLSTTATTSRSASHSPHPASSASRSQSTASYFSYPVTHVVSGLYRRLTDSPTSTQKPRNGADNMISPLMTDFSAAVYNPKRAVSPFQPPPLTPLTLTATGNTAPLLSRALAEEIRLLVPPRLQLVDTWRLAYSLERDGSSLATLYENCRQYSHRSQRAGYVLVVRDSSSGGAVFGAYLTDAPHPAPHYYGTGECFLWRASVLASTPLVSPRSGDNTPMTEEMLEKAGLPPPPSADTTHASRSTTLKGTSTNGAAKKAGKSSNGDSLLSPPGDGSGSRPGTAASMRSDTSASERIRFKAFPYSGENDYMIFCETGFLSVGGGDGHFGLWLDGNVEKGVSAACQTFGNEPLSDDGTKFDILGVEVWYVGA